MFTGLIQDLGRVEYVASRPEGRVLTLSTRLTERLRVGDSLAVNGVCLTVGAPAGAMVEATAVPETIERSTLGSLAVGDRVHLEPALAAGEAMGGHIVQGHVDGLGRVVEQGRRGDGGWWLTVAAPPALLRFLVEKGSVAIDGVSLTVAALDGDRFSVTLVPHTLDRTLLRERRSGAAVNLEVDVLAKYVERAIAVRLGDGRAASGAGVGEQATAGSISEAWLREQGF